MWEQPPSPVRRAQRGSCPRPRSTRCLRHFLPFLLLNVRFQETLRHPLHATIAVTMFPPRLRHIKLQRSVLCGTMLALAHVANLNAPATPAVTAHSPARKPHRIPHSHPRQPPAAFRIAKVAELPQLLLRRSLSLMPRRRALPAPSASQRKPRRMRPRPVSQPLNRHEKWTSHEIQSSILLNPNLKIVETCHCSQSPMSSPVSLGMRAEL